MSKMVTIRFTTDFAPYKTGDTRKVRIDIGEKLRDEYKVAEIIQSGNVMVRVIRPLMKEIGADWYPNSVHIADINFIKPYIDSGYVMIDGDDVKTYESTDDDDEYPGEQTNSSPVRRYPKPVPHAGWFKMHSDWNGVTLQYAITCISLAAQSNDRYANDILNQWAENGEMHVSDGKVWWDT